MQFSRPATIALVCSALAMGGCASGIVNASPIETFRIGPPPAPGKPLTLCQRLAADKFESTFQLHKGFSSDAWAKNQARVSAETFYARCLGGRIN